MCPILKGGGTKLSKSWPLPEGMVGAHMNKPFRVCLLPVLLLSHPGARTRRVGDNKKKRSAANEGLKY
jgi:hypothetical protein